jgi:hypothetical protein
MGSEELHNNSDREVAHFLFRSPEVVGERWQAVGEGWLRLRRKTFDRASFD